jgi:hypothetical protein
VASVWGGGDSEREAEACGGGAGKKTGWRFTARIRAAPAAAPPDPRKPRPQIHGGARGSM